MLSLHSDLKKHFEDIIIDNEIREEFVNIVKKNKNLFKEKVYFWVSAKFSDNEPK